MKLFYFSVNEDLAKSICEDLKLELPQEWGDSINIWYGSRLYKTYEGNYQVLPSGNDKRKSQKKDILHILEHFV